MAQQDIADILKRVQRIQIVANRTVNDLFAGQYKSVFRGRGMEFDEVREYQPGDDVRSIDWNVTARTGAPFIKRFCEERELTVLFLVDVSASGAFGSGARSKLDLVVEVAALLMFSALKNNDKVGLLTFCDTVLDYYPPRKGKANVLRLIRQLVAAEPVARPTDLAGALEFLSRVQKRRVVAFLISDFLSPLPLGEGRGEGGKPRGVPGSAGRGEEGNRGGGETDGAQETRVQHALALSNSRHDLIAVTVTDPREHVLPDVGFISLVDAETGRIVELDTRHPQVRTLFQTHAGRRCEELSRELRKIGVDQLPIRTDEDYLISLRRFFRMRERRFR